MFMKKKQLLREFPNKDSCSGSQEAEVEMTALGINLYQPLTDQLTKHHKSLKTRSWEDGTNAARNFTASAADINSCVVAVTENVSDHLDENSSLFQANNSSMIISKWSEDSRNELGEKDNQMRNDITSKAVDVYSNSSMNSSFGKSLNGVSFSSSDNATNATKLYNRHGDSFCANGKEFEDKQNSPSNEKLKQVEMGKDPVISSSSAMSSPLLSSASLSSPSSLSSSLLSTSSSSLPSLAKGLYGRGQSICSALLPDSLSERTSSVPTLSGYPLCSLPLQLLPALPNSAALNHQLMMQQQQQQQQQHAAAQLQQLQLLQQRHQQQQQQPPHANSNSVLSSYPLHADNMLLHQLEMLWQQKYPTHAVPPGWMLFQYQDELLRDPRLPLLKEFSISREKDEAMYERERMLRKMVEKEKLDWERQERENSERERMEMERHQKEKKERERWEQEKHGSERQEHDRTLERERREWEHHQQEARRDQQQRLQLEMHQRRELIVDESASSASDAVNQHFHESFLRLASQKGEGTRMEVANPSYAYVTGPRNIYKDRVKIERHQNPLCSKIEEESKYLKSYSCDSKLQDARESGQHPILRQEISQSENSRHEAQKQESKHSSHSSNLPSLLNFNLYGYQPTNKEHLFNSSGQASANRYKDDAYPKIESGVSKHEELDSSGTCKNGDSEPNNDPKQASVIMEPRGSIQDLQSDIYRHGSITLGTAGSSLHRARSEASHSFGMSVRQSGFICSTEGNHNTLVHSGSKSAIRSPLSTSTTKDQKHGLNLTSSPKPIQAVSAGMLNVGTATKDRINPWSTGGKEQQYELWREAAGMVHQKNSVANLSHQKLTNFPTQNISSVSQLPSSDHQLVTFSTCSLIQQGLVPNPMYISSAISISGASSALAPNSALHRSNHSHMMVPTLCTQDIAKSFTDINASVKRRPKKEINGSGMKKSRLDSNESRFPVSKPASMITSSLGDSATNLLTGLSGNSQPAYLDNFKSFVDHAVQNAFLQDKDVETDQSSSVREKMRQLIESEPGAGDDTTHEFGISTDDTALAATQEPEKEFVCEAVSEYGERSSPCMPTSVAVVTMASAPSVTLTPIPTVQSQLQLPVSAPSPGCASLSSLSSLAENVNRGRSAGCVDTDSDTLSAHSPSVTALPKSAGTPPPSGSAPLSSIHHKFHRKAWLHHYLNEDKKSSSCSFAVSSKLVQPSDNKADGAVRGCYISLSYMSKDAQSQSPVKVTKDLNLSKNEDLEDSEGAGSSDSHNCKRARKKKSASGTLKRVKSSDPGSPPMPDLVQEKQLEVAENISDHSQEEDDNLDTQSSSSSKIPASEKPGELDSLSSQTDCETKMAARLQESKDRGKLKGNPSSILECKPLNSLSEAKRKKSKEAFLQDGACSDITPKLVKCRECKMSRTQRNKNLPNIFCRFYAFRKLCYSAKGFITVAGFSKPTDADADDIQLWMPICSKPDPSLTVMQAKYILSNIRDSCLMLFDLENEAATLTSFQAKVAWKRPIQGVREMCDVCDATLFDIHWACNKCGFAVCAECYRSHSHDEANPDTDESKWLTCSANRHEHEPETLMITQIIPSDVRMVVGRMLREVSAKWKIRSIVQNDRQPVEVDCLARTNGIYEPCHLPSKFFHNGVRLDDRSTKGRTTSRKKQTLGSVAPFLPTGSSEKIESSDRASGLDNYSKVEGSKSESDSDDEMNAKKFSTRHEVSNVCTDYECRSTDKCKDPALEGDPLHLWVDDGRLLQLLDSQNSENIRLFQQGWQHAIPILISNCDKQLRPELWNPGSFSKEFGHVKVDLVDCSTGIILKSQPMDKFWNGFRHSSAPRNKQGGSGTSSILRLKDWPPVEDWAGPLASRNQDLNRLISVSDYYHPAGAFNLISHLPEFFVRPDLTTRIHASYSSCAQHRVPFSKLRLDLADSINIMMYVETATTEDIQNATRALKEAGYNARAKSAYKVTSRVGAVWHIFRPQDAEKIREFLKKVDASNSSHRMAERGVDPLADNSSYLDKALRARLLNECGIQSTVVVQCLGDALFLPAMTPYQVKVIHSCVMVSKEFLSPESVRSCFARMQQARKHGSPDCVSNIDDQLQIKNIIYHSVKDAVAVLQESDP